MTIRPKKYDFERFHTIALQKKGPKIADRPCIHQRFLSILAIFKFNRENLNKSTFEKKTIGGTLLILKSLRKSRTPEFAFYITYTLSRFENPVSGIFGVRDFRCTGIQIPEYGILWIKRVPPIDFVKKNPGVRNLRINRVPPIDFLKFRTPKKNAGRIFCYGAPREGAL